MAEEPCKDCLHYAPIIKGTRPTRHGWCAAKSLYPAQEKTGQVFPRGVTRAKPGEPAKPIIVVGADTVKHCTLFRRKS